MSKHNCDVNKMLSAADCLTSFLESINPEANTASGKRFFGKLDAGPLAYFHYAMPPLEQMTPQTRELGLSGAYASFLQRMNGGTFFDKCLYIFGVQQVFSRSIDLEGQVSVSFEMQNAEFHAQDPLRFSAGWRRVGILDLSNRYYLMNDPAGEGVIERDGRSEICFDTFDGMVCCLVEVLSHGLAFGVSPSLAQIDEVERRLFR